MSLKKSLLLIFLILLMDQISKVYIKTHFILGESHDVFSWFKILFIENEGAAWGTKLSDLLPISESAGKLVLTIFRIFAVFGIGYWLWDIIKKTIHANLDLGRITHFCRRRGVTLSILFSTESYLIIAMGR